MAKRTSRSKASETAGDPQTDPPKAPRASTRTKRAAPVTSAPADAPAPSEDEIRQRAYERYLERGGGQGSDFEDWLDAEEELRHRKK